MSRPDFNNHVKCKGGGRISPPFGKPILGPNFMLLIISSQSYIYGEPTTARASPYLKNLDVAAPQKYDPGWLELEFPKVIKGNFGPTKF